VKIKTLICNCKGLSAPFRNADMNTLPFEIESELDVDYAAFHPQLCGLGGNSVLEDVLRAAEDDPDTYVLVGACAADEQMKLFQRLLRATGFPEARFVPLDISDTTNDGILERMRAKIESLTHRKKPH
jgi:hypothetical protein